MATSHASLAALLDGLDAATLGTLARNDIRSIDDLQALSPEDIKELGLSVGHRNRLRRRIATSYTAASSHAAAGAGAAVAAELSSDGKHVTSCGPSCLRFALDEQPQACAAAGTHGSNRTTAAEAAALANPALMDVAPFRVARWLEPTRHPRIPSGVAVATALYQARNTSRFTSGPPSDVAPCAALAQMRALRGMGGLEGVDYVVVHAGLLSWQLRLLARHGVKLFAGTLPPAAAPYPSEYERAMMLKVDVLALTSYTRVLFLDVDMYPRRPVAALFTTEYAEDFVAFAESSAPYGANLFMVRPSRAAHTAARAASDARSFSVGRGWNGSGLLTWHSLRGSAPCDMPYATRLRGGDACAVWPYWHARCTQLHVTNWNYVSASADNGILWWLFNLSSLTSPSGLTSPNALSSPSGLTGFAGLTGLTGLTGFTSLTGTHGPSAPLAARILHRPLTPKGEPEPTASGGWWAHAQSMCKPWLATPKILAGSERCRGS